MAEAELDLLTEPLFGMRSADRETGRLSLPGVLAALGSEHVESFTALQAHQGHAWHAFLVQLGAIALHRSGTDDPVLPEERWRELLLALTTGRHEPWCLVVPDLAQPAFMQPPVPEGSLERFHRWMGQPDALDVLVTSKNHDVKRARVGAPEPEHWVYALVSLQTMAAFAGRDTYGIARMNGGFGSRPAVALSGRHDLGSRFRRDIGVLLRTRPMLPAAYGFAAEGGCELLWLTPWDGSRSLSLEQCGPFFIEICRRVRMERLDGEIVARTAPTKSSRLEAKARKGDLGDPWIPVRRDEAAALTITGQGFTYDLLQRLLFQQDFALGAAGHITPAELEGAILTAVALAGGQGETNGFHARWLPVPGRVQLRLMEPESHDRLAARSKRRVERVSTLRLRVLKPALCALLQSGDDALDFRDDRPQRWLDRLDHAVDRVFFEDLWADVEVDDEEADRRWSDRLRQLARSELEHAIQSSPLPTARRHRAIAAAERVFAGAWIRQFGSSPSKEHGE